jgi:hypothetical protein
MKLPPKPLEVLREPTVRAALTSAWVESKPGVTGGHEEGGFVVLGADEKLAVRRWPMGEGDLIQVPPHPGCAVDGLPIVASFHTHPNTGPDYLQEPSETDKRGVRDDADLKGSFYVGEFVVSDETVYLITPGGTVRELGSRAELFG